MGRRIALGLLLAALLSSASRARADRPDPRVERARVLFQEGLVAYEVGRLEEALERLREAQHAYPLPELTYNIARVYERMGDAPNAISHFRRYLRETQVDAAARQDIEARIRALEELQRRQSEQIFTAPPSANEMTAEAIRFFQRGVAMFRRGAHAAALQAFTEAHRLAPDLREVLYNIAVASERLGQLQDAIDYYQEYVRAQRDAPDRPLVERRIRELRRRLASGS